MRKILFILFVLTSCNPGANTIDEARLTGKVVSVADGDTFTILVNNERIRIRLYGIDAPERGQDYGTKARQFLNDLCYGKTVTVDKRDTDQYGRTIGIVFVDGMNVNEELVRNGLAWYYNHFVEDTRLEELEQTARRQKLNIWSMKNPVSPYEFRKKKKYKD